MTGLPEVLLVALMLLVAMAALCSVSIDWRQGEKVIALGRLTVLLTLITSAVRAWPIIP